MKEQLWERTPPRDLAEAQERLEHFFRHYNHFRPHQGIDGLVPADRFVGAETATRQAIEAAMEKNELAVAIGERPRMSVFLFGQVGGEQVSLHGERGRLVVLTSQGSRERDLEDLGIEREEHDDADDAGSAGSDGERDDERDGGGGDCGAAVAAGPRPTPGGPVGAAGLPDRAFYDAASEEERRQAHALSATILEYWTGLATKQEVVRRLSVPPIRVWQISQRAAAVMVYGLLRPPSGKRGPQMTTSPSERELLKENERLRKENALQRELIAVLRELPGNRDREVPSAKPEKREPAKEAKAKPPRREKSREPRALPGAAGVDPPPSP